MDLVEGDGTLELVDWSVAWIWDWDHVGHAMSCMHDGSRAC